MIAQDETALSFERRSNRAELGNPMKACKRDATVNDSRRRSVPESVGLNVKTWSSDQNTML